MFMPRSELIAVKKRHETEGLGNFILDPDLDFRREYGVDLWFAPCGCTLSIPIAKGSPTGEFTPARDHLIRLAPTDVRQEAELEVKRDAKRDMLAGILFLLGGCIVSAISLAAVPPESGRYFIFFGAIGFGVIVFFRGLWHYLRPRLR